MADAPPSPGFTDSDQAWFDALSGAAPSPATRAHPGAAAEGDLLRRALARRRSALDAEAEVDPSTEATAADPPELAAALSAEAHERSRQRLHARLRALPAAASAPSADLPAQAQPEPSEPRPALRPAPAQPVAPRWRWARWKWAGSGALAAAVLMAVVVLRQQGSDFDRIYDEPPELGQRGDTQVQTLAVDRPREAAEALHAALRAAGEPADLRQHGRVFIVLLQVSSETPPAALAALRAAGATAQPGPQRIEFRPR